MEKDFLTIQGKQVRVEANWNAIVAFLEASGRDSMQDLANFGTIKPSDVAGLMAACINEGERLEGRESSYSAQEIGQIGDFKAMTDFLSIYFRQSAPKVKNEDSDGKKKD